MSSLPQSSPRILQARTGVICALYALCFYAPWERYTTHHSVGLAWLRAAELLAQTGFAGLQKSALILTATVLTFAVAGTAARLYSTTHLRTESRRSLHALLALGTWLLSWIPALLMPLSGAIALLLALAALLLWFVALTPTGEHTDGKLGWLVLGCELYPLLLTASFAWLAWRFNGWEIGRAALISLGVALVARAAQPKVPSPLL